MNFTPGKETRESEMLLKNFSLFLKHIVTFEQKKKGPKGSSSSCQQDDCQTRSRGRR